MMKDIRSLYTSSFCWQSLISWSLTSVAGRFWMTSCTNAFVAYSNSRSSGRLSETGARDRASAMMRSLPGM